MATEDQDTSQSGVLWERLYARFLKGRGEPSDLDEGPRHRGLLITVCFLLSIMLWFSISLTATYTRVIQMRTEVTNLPPNLALRALPPRSVQVQVQGDGLQLMRLYYNAPVLPINASEDQVDLAAAALNNLPGGVSLESTSPGAFIVQKEERISRTVPIRLYAAIRPADTHDFTEWPQIEPDSVEVSGARSIVDNLAFWPTEYVEYEGLKDSVELVVPLADTLSQLIQREINATRLTARAEVFTEGERELDVRITGVYSPEKNVTLDPSVIEVRYTVPLSQYRDVERARDFFATVSYDEIRADTTGRVRPVLQLPEGYLIRDVRMSPASLRYYDFVIND